MRRIFLETYTKQKGRYILEQKKHVVKSAFAYSDIFEALQRDDAKIVKHYNCTDYETIDIYYKNGFKQTFYNIYNKFNILRFNWKY